MCDAGFDGGGGGGGTGIDIIIGEGFDDSKPISFSQLFALWPICLHLWQITIDIPGNILSRKALSKS